MGLGSKSGGYQQAELWFSLMHIANRGRHSRAAYCLIAEIAGTCPWSGHGERSLRRSRSPRRLLARLLQGVTGTWMTRCWIVTYNNTLCVGCMYSTRYASTDDGVEESRVYSMMNCGASWPGCSDAQNCRRKKGCLPGYFRVKAAWIASGLI